MGLSAYNKKRNFRVTPEPAGGDAALRSGGERGNADRAFVVQKHDASRLHYDFRLALDGVLKSWAVPKGPSLDPDEQRLAVEVEDHPLDYRDFEGVIPEGQYGGGTVMVWDAGTWEPLEDPHRGLKKGKLKFTLRGQRLRGDWLLVRMKDKKPAGKHASGSNWLLRKLDDDEADARKNILEHEARSVLTGRDLKQIAARADRVWDSKTGEKTGGTAVADLPGAAEASMPRSFTPQLATLVDSPPKGDDWLHEIKFDGYRILARIAKGDCRLVTRGGKDWTDRFSPIAAALARLPLDRAILDGEIVAQDADGKVSFQSLQNHLQHGDKASLVVYLFDVPYLDGYDLTRVPLVERKAVLQRLLTDAPAVVNYSDHIRGDGDAVVEQACKQNLEGIVSKRADSAYKQSRTRDWVKSKCVKRQEFAVVGYTDPTGSRTGFGSLLLAIRRDDAWRYSGKVGSGFTETSLRNLHKQLKALRTSDPPLRVPASERRGAHWVTPALVAEVRFTEWTHDGRLRHPVFVGLREDKPAMSITRETPEPVNGDGKKNRKNNGKGRQKPVVLGVAISSPDRVVFPEQGLTKLALAEYYRDVMDWVLPHVVHRPLALVRCPEGRGGECFFQKHVSGAMPEAITTVEVAEKGKDEAPHVQITDEAGLIALVQVGVLEIHTWGARSDRLEKPDRMIFDLDPDPAVTWSDVVRATRQLKEVLDALELVSFVKLSGGKGVHVVVPLAARDGWGVVKPFSKAVAQLMERRDPSRYVSVMTKAKRKGKIFVDYLRNGRGATAVAAYSTRARPSAPVSAPITWDELSDKIRPDHYTLDNIRQRLSRLKRDPWHGYDAVRQSISRARRDALDSILKKG